MRASAKAANCTPAPELLPAARLFQPTIAPLLLVVVVHTPDVLASPFPAKTSPPHTRLYGLAATKAHFWSVAEPPLCVLGVIFIERQMEVFKVAAATFSLAVSVLLLPGNVRGGGQFAPAGVKTVVGGVWLLPTYVAWR